MVNSCEEQSERGYIYTEKNKCLKINKNVYEVYAYTNYEI